MLLTVIILEAELGNCSCSRLAPRRLTDPRVHYELFPPPSQPPRWRSECSTAALGTLVDTAEPQRPNPPLRCSDRTLGWEIGGRLITSDSGDFVERRAGSRGICRTGFEILGDLVIKHRLVERDALSNTGAPGLVYKASDSGGYGSFAPYPPQPAHHGRRALTRDREDRR